MPEPESAQTGPTPDEFEPRLGELSDRPNRPMTAEELELLLEAEFSGYRQDTRAARLYVEAAETSRDIGVVQRAFEVSMALEESELALQMALLWREIEPGLLPDRFTAQLLARVGEVEAAWEIARDIPDRGLTLRIVAAEAIGLNDPARLEWLDQQLEGIENTGYQIWIARALLRDALNDPESAVELARRAYESNPTDTVAVELYAATLASLSRNDELEALLREWLMEHWTGQNNDIRIARLVTQLPLDRAINLLQDAIDQLDQTEELRLMLGQAYLNIPQVAEAEALFNGLLDHPDYADIAHIQLAQMAERENNVARALRHYSEVYPGRFFSQANQRAGEILLSTGTSSDLNQFYQMQRTRYPIASEQLYMLQARLLNEVRSGEELYRVTSRALQITPDSIELRYLRSLASGRMDRLDQVEQDLRYILDMDPDNAMVLNSLGYHLTDRTDRHEEAYELIRRALMLEPEDPAIIDSMGWVLFKLGRYEEALAYLQEAHNRFYDQEIIVHLLETLLQLGRDEEARALYMEASENLPNSQMLQDAGQRLNLGTVES